MILAEALLQALKDHGANEVFGIPGDFALDFFKVIEESKILPLFTMSHEPAVGFAADAAARFRGGLGVAAVTYGAGAFNLVNAVAGAYAEKSPVVVISGAPAQAQAHSGLLLHHQGRTLDTQARVFAEITCDQARLDDPAKAPADIARVLRSAKELARPVYLELPRDMVRRDCEPVVALPPTPSSPEAVAAAAEEILGRLRKAQRPCLMVGVEARRYGLEAEVETLARRLGVPVVTSFMGRGLLAGADSPLLGTYLGAAGDPDIAALVEGSDALFLLGEILSDTNFGISERQIDFRHAIHAFDRQVALGFHTYPNLPMGDLVTALLARVPEGRVAAQHPLPAYPQGLNADDGAIAPTDIARAVNDLMATHGPLPIAADIGDCLFTAMEIAQTELMAPGYYAGMGFGVPAGLGAQAASGERMLILVGDGAFQMTGWELGNCRRLGLDPIVLVFNNSSWEMLRAFQPESQFHDLGDWRFAEMAAGLGGDGHRVQTRAQLKAALERAIATRGRFQLIEVMLPAGKTSDTLARFVGRIKRGATPSSA